MGERSNTDHTAARARARDEWIRSAEKEFVGPFQKRDNEPVRAVQDLRKVLEGWAHAMTLILDDEFKPYEGKELHRRDLGKMLTAITPHLTPELRRACKHVKENSDPANHNNGSPAQASPLLATAPLCSAAALLDDLYRRLERPQHPEFARIVSELLGKRPPSPIGRTSVEKEAAAPAQPTLGLAPMPRERVPLAAATQPSARAFAILGAFAVLVLVGLGLVRNMRFPMKSFFGRKDASETFVRDQTAKWFTNNTNTKTFFDNCREGTSPAKERYAVRCDVRLEPALREALAPQCFVFDGEGLLVSRTDSNSPESCPP